MSNEGDCRTARTTPGLLKIYKITLTTPKIVTKTPHMGDTDSLNRCGWKHRFVKKKMARKCHGRAPEVPLNCRWSANSQRPTATATDLPMLTPTEVSMTPGSGCFATSQKYIQTDITSLLRGSISFQNYLHTSFQNCNVWSSEDMKFGAYLTRIGFLVMNLTHTNYWNYWPGHW